MVTVRVTLRRGVKSWTGEGAVPRAVATSWNPVSPCKVPAPSLAGPGTRPPHPGLGRGGGVGVKAQETAREEGQPVAAEGSCRNRGADGSQRLLVSTSSGDFALIFCLIRLVSNVILRSHASPKPVCYRDGPLSGTAGDVVVINITLERGCADR